jgi:hypothetical protein
MLDITTLAAWGEFIGGIAVVVSLIYLASQIRYSREQMSQNSKLIAAQTTAATSQVRLMTYALIVQDPEVARIWWDGLDDRDSLSEADRRRFDPLYTMAFHSDGQQFQFQRDGVGSPAQWELVEAGLRRAAQRPGVRQWFDDWRATQGKEFCEYFDGLIRESEASK